MRESQRICANFGLHSSHSARPTAAVDGVNPPNNPAAGKIGCSKNEKPGAMAGAFSVSLRHLIVALPRARIKGTMADSAFWRDLADKFSALKDSVRASGASASKWIEAEILVKLGASEIANAGAPDSFLIWRESCTKAGYPFQVSESNEVSSRDELEQSIYNGYLDGLCEASATFCKRLEAQALEAEIEMRRAQKGRAHVSQSVSGVRPLSSKLRNHASAP
jgi:hypothetical protein